MKKKSRKQNERCKNKNNLNWRATYILCLFGYSENTHQQDAIDLMLLLFPVLSNYYCVFCCQISFKVFFPISSSFVSLFLFIFPFPGKGNYISSYDSDWLSPSKQWRSFCGVVWSFTVTTYATWCLLKKFHKAKSWKV